MSDKQLTWEEAVQWLKAQPEQQTLVRQCYYDDPVLEAAERFYQSEEWQAVTALLDPFLPGRVLDLGAGRGISSYAFAKHGCAVTALEPNPSPIVGIGAIQSLIDRTDLVIDIVQNHGESLPFADQTFDMVYGRAVLHHASHLSQFCRECHRVLKSGGALLFTREHVISQPQDLPLFLEAHPLHWLYGGENAYLLGEYYRAMRMAGFTVHCTLKPFDSVIHYSPMTQLDFQNELATTLKRLVGIKPSTWLAQQQLLQSWYGWFRSMKSHMPGRLYSFLALKP
jgi:ubiquinone/menaquinone biosynthesis C-methylase UbiE